MITSEKIASIEKLQSEIRGLERGPLEKRARTYFSSGIPELDGLLPGGGLASGSLIEILAGELGCGAVSVGLKLANASLAAKPAWAVVDPDGSFYAPAAGQQGADLARLVVVRTLPAQAGWAFNQLLSCSDIGASFFLSQNKGDARCALDNMAYRRFQLAAERGGTLGFIFRPLEALRRPCWAEVRLQVEREASAGDASRRLKLTVIHARGSQAGGSACATIVA